MTQTMMAREIAEIPVVTARQLGEGLSAYKAIGRILRDRAPLFAATSARGTSDHAATYLKYLVETRLGLPVASIGPSVASIYKAPLHLDRAALFAVSQSGASPDLLALLEAGRKSGAVTVALLNAEGSPAASVSEHVAPLLAGPEKAVAASKSYVASLVAMAAIVAEWTGDEELTRALALLPDAFADALRCDWSEADEAFVAAESAYCLGRGPGLTIAAEAALKFKETCALHAEGFSSAEAMHGPLVLAGEGLKVLTFVPGDVARAGVIDTAQKMAQAGADVWLVDQEQAEQNTLPAASAPHPALVAPVQAVSFYVFAERLSRLRGHDPDRPMHLKKVTETV